MAVSCVPNDLARAAKCFECLNDKQERAVDTYLLAVIAGGSTDPEVLAKQAKAFQDLNAKQHASIQDYLLCQIANK